MRGTDPGSAREEAERLVVTVLAAAHRAASGVHPGSGGQPGGGFATGSAECCVCPVCRTIAAIRDPDPEFAERLATGAADLAAGVASLLRALSSATGAATPGPSTPGPSAPGPSTPDPSSAGSTTTAGFEPGPAGRTGRGWPPAAEPDVWTAATRSEAAVPGSRAADSAPVATDHRHRAETDVGTTAADTDATGVKPMARKAVKPPRSPGDRA